MRQKKSTGFTRRHVVAASATLAGGAFLGGFSGRALASAPPTEITFASAPFFSKASIDGLIEAYNSSQGAVHATYLELPSASDPVALHEDLVKRLKGADGAPDVFSLDVVRIAEFAAMGLSLPLRDHFDQGVTAAFFPGIVQGCTVGGELMALPWFADSGMLFYRADILERIGVGVPQTWDDLVAAAKRGVSSATPHGFLWQGKKSEALVCNLVSVIGSNGGTILADDGAIRLGDTEAITAVQFLHDAITRLKISPPDVLAWDEEPCRKPFNAGQAVFLRNWSYTWGLAQQSDSTVAGKVGVAPLPHFPGKASAACLGGYQFGVNAKTKNKSAAIDFLTWLSTAETQLRFATVDGLPPTRQGVFDDPALAKAQPFLAQLKNVFVGALARPVTPQYPKVTLAIQAEVAKGLASGDIAHALGNAAKKIKSVLAT